MDVLVKVVSTVMVWVSWIHEDVGHAASYFVYNPASVVADVRRRRRASTACR